MDGSGEDASEDDPEVGGRTELGAHDGTEDRTGSRNVQELDHKYFPSGHRDEVDAVGFGDRRGGPGCIGAEHFFDKSPVEEIPDDKGSQTEEERIHKNPLIYSVVTQK